MVFFQFGVAFHQMRLRPVAAIGTIAGERAGRDPHRLPGMDRATVPAPGLKDESKDHQLVNRVQKVLEEIEDIFCGIDDLT